MGLAGSSTVPARAGRSLVTLAATSSPDVADVPGILARRTIRTAFQPVVDLRTGAVVAHEALLRGPAGTSMESPVALIAAARALGRSAELDIAALRSHLRRGVGAHGVGGGMLFVNLEPSTLALALDDVVAALEERPAELRIVVEFTERALAREPAAITAAAERLREVGCAIALDDVGAEPASLAFMPLLRPEVVKLDLSLLRTVDDVATITVAHAVRAYAEASGAEVVAEGVETPEDRTRAVVLGATLGQGWLWGRPDPEPRPVHGRLERVRVSAARTDLAGRTPFGLLTPDETQAVPKTLLLSVTRGLELAAVQSRVPPVLLSCFQDARNVGRPTLRRYGRLAERLPLVGMFGVGLTAEPAPGVRGGGLSATDELRHEWTVVVLGAHEAIALVARERPLPPDANDDRWFDFAVTHERARVTDAALLMMARLGA